MHSCNSSNWEAKAGGSPCLKKKKIYIYIYIHTHLKLWREYSLVSFWLQIRQTILKQKMCSPRWKDWYGKKIISVSQDTLKQKKRQLSYSRGRDQEGRGSKPDGRNSSWYALSTQHKKGLTCKPSNHEPSVQIPVLPKKTSQILIIHIALLCSYTMMKSPRLGSLQRRQICLALSFGGMVLTWKLPVVLTLPLPQFRSPMSFSHQPPGGRTGHFCLPPGLST
jgi:hypothetical protein